jgi:acetylornithine deacetylase/succinyl-diaminopimelate desuccinylase-like protein
MSNDALSWETVTREASEYLSRYIQIDTTNPPGNETEGAAFLKEILAREGIPGELVESESGRGSLIARLQGDGSRAPLLLLSHIDVVPAEKGKWSYPPFSGKVVEGEIWGRGALDCKSLGIMQAMVLILAKRSGLPLQRDVVLAATADEERGGTFGVDWLFQHRPDLLKAEAVLNEGGGVGMSRNGKNFYLCQVAEKGPCWLRLTFRGSPGHASLPREDNCVVALGKSVAAVGSYRSPVCLPEVTRRFMAGFSQDPVLAPILEKLAQDPRDADALLSGVADRGLKQLLQTMVRNTFVPTVVKGGEKTNVIPSECVAEIDCRIVPGETPERVLEELHAVLKDVAGFSLEVLHSASPNESSTSHELFPLMERALLRHDPDACFIPFVSSGATDSRYFREHQVPAFGFAPQLIEGELAEHQDMVHGHNERISQKNLTFGIKVLFEVVREYCG